MAVAVCARAGRPAVAGNPSKLVHRHILSPVKPCLCAPSSCCRCATQTASRPLCSSAPTPTSRYARRPARLFCCQHAAVPLSSLRVSCPVTTQLVHVCHSLLHPCLVAAGEGGFHGWAQAGGHHLRCSLHRHLPAGRPAGGQPAAALPHHPGAALERRQGHPAVWALPPCQPGKRASWGSFTAMHAHTACPSSCPSSTGAPGC